MLKTLRWVLLLIVTLPALANATSGIRTSTECRVFIRGFTQTILWYADGERLKITAESACGSGHGRALDLKNVQLTWEKKGSAPVTRIAETGTYSHRLQRVLLGTSGSQGPVLVDLDSRRLIPMQAREN